MPLRSTIEASLNLLGLPRARSGSKPARSGPKEQRRVGRAEFFAPPGPVAVQDRSVIWTA